MLHHLASRGQDSQHRAWGLSSGATFEGCAEPEEEEHVSPESKQPHSWAVPATRDLLAAARLCVGRTLLSV